MKKQVFNPYLPSYEYIPDGEPYVFNDRLYIFGSHDRFNGTRYCQNDYVAWSTPVNDLSDWRYEGIIYETTQDPKNREQKRTMYAPDVTMGPDGRFYLYYTLDFRGRIAVAVCDTPVGKYEYLGEVKYQDGIAFGAKKEDKLPFDPAILVDDDDRIWLYSGFSPQSAMMNIALKFFGSNADGMGGCVMELESDMLTIKTPPKLLIPGVKNGRNTDFEGHEFFEASSIRKVGNIYYFVYSSALSHELCYATSDFPDKGFKYGGVIFSNGDIGFAGNDTPQNYWGNNHGSFVEINGKYYIFGHRPTNYHEFSRQGIAEEIKITTDGKIEMVEMTSCGLNDGALLGVGIYEARIACCLMSKKGACKSIPTSFMFGKKQKHPCFTQDGMDRENNPNQYIHNMTDGTVAGFKYFDLTTSDLTTPNLTTPKGIAIKTRGNGQGRMVVTEALNGVEIASIDITTSTDWKEEASHLYVEPGIKPLYFTYHGTGTIDFLSFELK